MNSLNRIPHIFFLICLPLFLLPELYAYSLTPGADSLLLLQVQDANPPGEEMNRLLQADGMRQISSDFCSLDSTLILAEASATGADAPDAQSDAKPASQEVPEDGEPGAQELVSEDTDEVEDEEVPDVQIADPLEPWNKAMFYFNDKLYFWVMKPVTQGYKFVVPEDFRIAIGNLYDNLYGPVRIVNNLLQLKIKNAGNEVLRFLLNTSIGFFGMADVAKDPFGLKARKEDFNQTLGSYGIGHGIYIVWPLYGPSSIRDSAGFAGDRFLYPLAYISDIGPEEITFWESAGLYVHEKTNALSFKIGDYEAFKKAAIDPYVSMRDAFVQNQRKLVKD